MIKILPMGLRVYLILEPVGEKMAGSLYVPQTHSELCRLATVEAVGEEVTLYKPGDRVLVSYVAGRVISIVTKDFTPSNDIHRIVSEEEIMCKVTEE